MSKVFIKNGKTFIYGFFVKTVWRDEKSGGSCFLMNTEEEPPLPGMHRGSQLCYDPSVGSDVTFFSLFCNATDSHIPLFEEFMPILVSGTFREGKEAGRYDFVVSSVEEVAEHQMMITYLVKNFGISGSRAWSVMSVLGDDIFKGAEAENAAGMIEEAADLTKRKATSIITSLTASAADREVFNRLAPFGVSYGSARKAIRLYGEHAIDRLLEHPWERGMSCGMTLAQCDAFAFANGKKPDDGERIKKITEMTMDEVGNGGDVWCTPDRFAQIFHRNAGMGSSEYCQSSDALETGLVTTGCIGGMHAVLFKPFIRAEARIFRNIKRLASEKKTNFTDGSIPDVGIAYSDRQKSAFSLVEDTGVKAITGGPGTGKTTTMRGIVEYYRQNMPGATIKLAAPTGRAAQRLSESCGMPATTVHQLIEYQPYGETCMCRNRANPIDADFIVIDEMSMMNIEIFDLLLEAVKTGTTLLLVGDVDQLEPIGAGAVFRDMLSYGSQYISGQLLKEVFRQGNDSGIVKNAGLIRKGSCALAEGPDFHIIRTSSGKESLEAIQDLIKKHHDPQDPFRCQILCPARKGDAGVNSINAQLQKMLNPSPEGGRLVYGHTAYGKGDKVIMVKNNYEAGYYNGDVGIIKAIDKDNVTVELRDEIFKIHRSDLSEMSLAYGMTIHKSQGSEFETVIVSLPLDVPGMLVRSLFYTAVTRAKKNVFVVTEGDAMETAVRHQSPPRKTCLGALLCDDRRMLPLCLKTAGR